MMSVPTGKYRSMAYIHAAELSSFLGTGPHCPGGRISIPCLDARPDTRQENAHWHRGKASQLLDRAHIIARLVPMSLSTLVYWCRHIIPRITPQCQVCSVPTRAGIPIGTRKQPVSTCCRKPATDSLCYHLGSKSQQDQQQFIHCYIPVKACVHAEKRSLNLGHANRGEAQDINL